MWNSSLLPFRLSSQLTECRVKYFISRLSPRSVFAEEKWKYWLKLINSVGKCRECCVCAYIQNRSNLLFIFMQTIEHDTKTEQRWKFHCRLNQGRKALTRYEQSSGENFCRAVQIHIQKSIHHFGFYQRSIIIHLFRSLQTFPINQLNSSAFKKKKKFYFSFPKFTTLLSTTFSQSYFLRILFGERKGFI